MLQNSYKLSPIKGCAEKIGPNFAKSQLHFKRSVSSAVAYRWCNRILERCFVDKFLFDSFIRVFNLASVIDSFPEPLVMDTEKET